MTNTNRPAAGWYLDPAGLADGRYWDGDAWTGVATRAGTTVTVPIDPTYAAVPPLPGTAIQSPVPPRDTEPNRSAFMIGVGVMVAALVALLLFAVIGSNDSSNEPPTEPTTPATAPPVTDAPADGG